MSLRVATWIVAAVFAAAGLLSVWVAAAGSEWFFRSPDVRMLTGRLSRIWARLLYGLLGVAFVAVACCLLSEGR